MKLDEAFERVVVVNLPFKAERRKRLEKNMQDVGIADLKNIRWERAICGDWTLAPKWWGAGNGAWGCLMSHVRVAQDAIHDKVASYCILEDDVVFHPRAAELLTYFWKELPNTWGQVYLGGQFLHREPAHVSPWVLRPYNVNRTHAYGVSAGTIPSFLQHVMNAPDYLTFRSGSEGTVTFDHNCFHLDHQLGRAHERFYWHTYAPRWWIAGQDEGESNISGRLNPRFWWHWRERGHQLPFFFIKSNAKSPQRAVAKQFLHAGNNLVEDTLVDIGVKAPLSDQDLLKWLRLIAGEAIEQWKLPGFEIPHQYPALREQVTALWNPGLIEADHFMMQLVAEYPFNGYCGGLPF
jgi:GR25 family glycosyltransferase involved in LPS biosynthesis